MATRLAAFALCLVLCAVTAIPAVARGPADDVRRHVEEAFQGFIDADNDRGGVSVEQRRALRRAADRIFDWQEMARGALGSHWAQATPPQRERFSRLFAQLFERLYMPMLERGAAAETAEKLDGSIAYVGETVRGDLAVLRLTWKRPGRNVVVDCAMRRKAGSWRIYDVSFDGLSMIDNYRAQFDHVIQRTSYQDLVTRIDAKLGALPIPGLEAAPSTVRRAPRLAESP